VLRVVKIFGQSISKNRSLYIVVNQVLKSGTSIGANVAESKNAVSKSGFINKLAIAL
jgi:four helix bundle protein